MKLLTTIAAVLISISAYSQDYIEYDKGYFTQNGEELSMEQIDDLTLLHKAGRGNFWRGFRFNRMHKDRDLRMGNNTANFLEGAVTGAAGGFAVLIGRLILDNGSGTAGPAALFIVPGAGLCAVSFKAFSRIVLSKKGCLKRRDKKFNKVADKLNEAIQSPNQ